MTSNLPQRSNPFTRQRISPHRAPGATAAQAAPPKPRTSMFAWAALALGLVITAAAVYWLMTDASRAVAIALGRMELLTDRVSELDREAVEIFGGQHRWHDVDQEPPPRCVRDWVESRADLDLLLRYNAIAASRAALGRTLTKLTQRLQPAGGTPTAEAFHQLAQGIRPEIEQAIRAADRELAQLKSLPDTPDPKGD